MDAIEIRQPVYGPQGQTFGLRIDGEQRWYWTEDEAWDARDEAMQAGHSVKMQGIPFRGAVAGI